MCIRDRHATGGEIFVRKAPACTIGKLAEAVCKKFSQQGADHPVNVTGIRPGEKLHETLVNEYEMQRATEEELFYAIHPEYHLPEHRTEQALGTEYTSANASELEAAADLNEACATGAWRAVALRGGAPWGCAGFVRGGNRRLRLWRDVCRERAAAARQEGAANATDAGRRESGGRAASAGARAA